MTRTRSFRSRGSSCLTEDRVPAMTCFLLAFLLAAPAARFRSAIEASSAAG